MIKKLLTLLFLILLIPTSVYAQADFKFNQPAGYGIPVRFSSVPYAENQVEAVLVNVIALFFTVGGLGVLIYFIWGAVDWILSGGDKEKLNSARRKMTNAIIGLVLLSLSYVIINLIGGIVGFNPLSNLQIRGLGDNPENGSKIAPNN